MPLSSVVGAQSIVRPGVCTSSTRPASPYEGQMIYESDTDMIALWNGSAWRYVAATTATSGSVLQVASTTKTDTTSTTSTTFVDMTGMSVSITPKATTSKIVIQASLNIGSSGAGPITGIKLVRGSTDVFIGDADGAKSRGSIGVRVDSEYQMYSTGLMYLDSPSTTSSTTYKLQWKTSSGTSYLNRIHNTLDDAGVIRGASSITVMEIAG